MKEYNTPLVDVAICDDALENLTAISLMVNEYMIRKKIEYTLLLFDHGEDIVDVLAREDVYTVLLLNTTPLGGGDDGISLAKRLRKEHIDFKLVLFSPNRDMALRGYEVEALRYLELPIDPDLFEEAMDCAFAYIFTSKTILLPTVQGDMIVDMDDILFIEPNNRRVTVHYRHRQMEVSLKFAEMIELMPPQQFVLSHRTVLVNLSHIETMEKDNLLLRNGTMLPLSKYRIQEVKTAYLKHLRQTY